MQLVIFNRSNTKADPLPESLYLRVALIYTRVVNLCSFNSEIMELCIFIDSIPEAFLCSLHDHLFSKELNDGDISCKQLFEKLKTIRKIKNKNKTELVMLQRLEQMIKPVKSDIYKFFQNYIAFNKLEAPLKFYEITEKKIENSISVDIIPDGLILMNSKDYEEDAQGQDPMMLNIIESYTENEQNLIFDEVIEELATFTNLDDNNNTENYSNAEFLSIPLFEFPFLHDLNYDQMKNVRDELKPIVEPFHQDYKKLQTELATLPFDNSQTQITTLIATYITPHLHNIQQNLDNNIYIQQQKNRYKSSDRIKVNMGSSSFKNQVNLLQKEEVILSFVANAITEKLSKSLTITNCAPFIYHKFIGKNKTTNEN